MPEWREAIRQHLSGARLSPEDELEITEELTQHLEDRYTDLRRQGLDDTAARRGTLDELGDRGHLERLLHDVVVRRPLPIPLGAGEKRRGIDGWWSDLRVGARMLRRSPGFTVIATLTLAIAIGVNTTIFSIVNALLLRPLPGLSRPEELVLIGRTQDGQGFDTFSYPDFVDYRNETRTLADVAASYAAPVHLSNGGASDRLRAGVVSGNYFHVLGVTAAQGRLFLPDEDGAPNAHPVVVLSYGTWERRFGGDRSVVGSMVSINAHPYKVVGVAHKGFLGTEKASSLDLFVPIAMVGQLRDGFDKALGARDAVWLDLFGRLAAGATPMAAEAELREIARRLQQQFPASNANRSVSVAKGLGFNPESRRDVRRFSGTLLGVVALVLLIACANVANLLLARGTARQRELSIRASLGASRSRLVRQLLAEGCLLAAASGVIGFLLGHWTLPLVLRLPLFGENVDVPADFRVFGFTVLVSMASAIIFGLPSAFRASRVDLVSALKAGTPGSTAGGTLLRNGLLVGQLCISVVLLATTMLFVRTLAALYAVAPGFETEHVLVATVDVALQGYDEERGRRFYADLERGTAGLPGVHGAALAYMLPLGGGGWDTRLFPAEQIPDASNAGLKTDINSVSATYFQTVSMPILRGRAFTEADRPGAPPVAVINEVVAEKLWPGLDPLGRRFRMGRTGDPIEVIGVLRTAKYRSLLEPARPFIYRPFAQQYQSPMTIHVNVDGDPRALIEPIRRLVASLDKDLPVYRVQTLAERLQRSVGEQRTAATLVGAYGLLALMLAAVGLYASMSYMVSRRTREIGIRIALGARSMIVLTQVLREALQVAMIGVVAGLLIAIPAAQLVRSQLFGVGPVDPVTLAVIPAVLAIVAIAAAYLPARRATHVDPVTALRAE